MPDLGKTQSDLWFWKLPVFLYSISTFLQFSRKNLFPQSLFPGNKRCFKIRTCFANRFFLDLKLLGCNYGMNFLSSETRKHPLEIVEAHLQNLALLRVASWKHHPQRSATTKVQWCIRRRHPPNIEHTSTLRVDTVLGGGFKDCIFLILCLPWSLGFHDPIWLLFFSNGCFQHQL